MNYLVIDLEMCKVASNYRGRKYKHANEIIQIGAVLLDEKYKQVDVLRQYVQPEYGVLNNFITNLTGIQNNQVKHAPKLQDALTNILDWIGDRQYLIYEWSNNDYKQLQIEINDKEIHIDGLDEFMRKERWVDYQDVFGKKYELGRNVGLEEALLLCDIEAEGKMHDGLDDAVNTAKIIEKLELNPEYRLIYVERQTEEEKKPLNTSMGDLLASLNIQLS